MIIRATLCFGNLKPLVRLEIFSGLMCVFKAYSYA